MPSGQTQPSPAKRVLWFVGLWLAGVGSVAMVALIIRLWMRLA